MLLSEGLSTWIEAQKEEVGDTDYEKVVSGVVPALAWSRLMLNVEQIVNFYLMALDRLYDVARPSSQLFSDLENFLCSIFAHCRPPDCAFALKDFCDHVWEKEKNSRFYFPEQLKKCLCALCEVCPGIERSEYIPSSSQFESQSQSQPLIGVSPRVIFCPKSSSECSLGDRTRLTTCRRRDRRHFVPRRSVA